MRTSLAFLIAVLSLCGCGKENKPESNETYYFSGTVDNAPLRWEVKATNNNSDTSRYHARAHYFYGQWPVDCATTDCYDLAAGSVIEERNKGNAVQVVFLKAGKTYDLNQLKPFFIPGTKQFGIQRTSSYNSTVDGILIRYYENGREWRSENGDQTGSSFESLEFKKATVDTTVYSQVWKARFSCKVYFSGLPPKNLQNCEIYAPAFYK